jgi:signal transduction histidine kinase/ligand-binding sensor domain-containing protein/DNA-binding response OmpR family regulator
MLLKTIKNSIIPLNKNKNGKFFLLWCLFWANSPLLLAFQSPTMTYLGMQHGLSNNAVTCIFQDFQGFMWFGTYDGLNRYDGYEFKVFRNNLSDSNSLVNNRIVKMTEDGDKNMWIGTHKGISVFNPATAKFSPVSFFSEKNKTTESIKATIRDIKTMSNRSVFIATQDQGLMVCQPHGIATQIPCFIQSKQSFTYQVRAMTVDARQVLWLFIDDLGLCVYNEKEKKITLVNNTVKRSNCLETDNQGNIWLGTETGLYQYNVTTQTFTLYDEHSGKLSYNRVVSLCMDKKQNLWVATDGGGINIIDLAQGKIRYISTGNDKKSLTSAAVYAIFEDKEERKWIGTLRGGINIIDANTSRFKTISHEPLNKNSLIDNFTLSFCEDDAHNIWIGTDGGGLSYWNRKQDSYTHFKHETGNAASLSNNFVTNIILDFNKDLWFATYGGGINRLHKGSMRFEHFKCIDNGVEHGNAWVLYEDSHKNLWASTLNDSYLYLFNRTKNQFEVFDRQFINVLTLQEDKDRQLWAGTFNQLIKIDVKEKKHAFFSINYPVRVIHDDKNRNFWIGTEGGGLLLFDRQKNTFSRFTDREGLSNNAILKALEDDKGQLWLSTFYGLSRFNPVEKRFKNYYQSDGLQSNQFNYNAALRVSSGEFLMGGINGFNVFFPDSIRAYNQRSKVLLTDLRVNNISITADDSYIKKKEGTTILEISVPFDKASISFDYAALAYSAPDKITYSYYLEGWDKNWNQVGAQRTANYTRLTEGTYFLKIKASSTEEDGNEEITTLKIVILPPWYRTIWAYLIYFGLIIAVLNRYLAYQKRQAQLKYDLALAQLNAEKEKEVSEKKISFFTHISHEFRTPLTLIINPLKEILSKNRKEEGQDISMIYRNARRLLSLVDQLLLFRKVDSVDQNMRIEKFNIGDVCREVYLSFSQHALANHIDFQYDSVSNDLLLYADKEKIEIILFNLVSNALKFTPSGGSIVLKLAETAETIDISVKDTGCGIPSDVENRLFDSFFQAENKEKAHPTGFGIGLYVSQKLALAHHATLSYTSEEEKGTVFSLILLKGKVHFGEKYISEGYNTEKTILHELIAEPIENNSEQKIIKNKSEVIDRLTSELPSMLIVDDNVEMRTYIKHIFEDSFTIFEAEDGFDGYELVVKETPNIVISDVIMRQVSGIEFCRKIKSNPLVAHIPVILLTASSSDEMKLKGIEGGAEDYMTKPFDKDMIVARVQNILRGRNQLQQYFYNAITLKPNIPIAGEHKAFIEKCITIVENHLADDNFDIPAFCREIGMSHPTLYKRVKSVSGLTVNVFIRYLRLRKAAELLINTDKTIVEVTYLTGFNDMKYFRAQFQKLFDMNPSEYVKQYRKVLGGK